MTASHSLEAAAPPAIPLTAALTTHLASLLPSSISRDSLRTSVLPSLLTAIAATSTALRNAQDVSLAGSSNSFGDDQLNVDVIAEEAIRLCLAQCPSVVTASSEEDPVEKPVQHTGLPFQVVEVEQDRTHGEVYTVAFDPLDGSSIIAPNWTVGTIVSLWDGATALHASPREKQIGAVLGVYGPRTTAVVALRLPGQEEKGVCFEVGLSDSPQGQEWDLIRSSVSYAPPPFKTRYFAPANLRSANTHAAYAKLIPHYMAENYTLRYCGGLVPDVVHALVKGHGVYLSPVTETSKAKLRRLYELFPLALVVECCGGQAVDPVTGEDILGDKGVEGCDERGGIVCGTAEEVEYAKEVLCG
ncbi:sedoheptulose-1,7-bisphosphatase [Pseudoneurospora amorphoporcata]|uniref:fructose-bisphosphatase n=1 Tax=Pseudoneurospora amorphoporcata TaxID=241081 RepID=A0AAN6P1G9_9PEZI|nr:sedoheptulose-1,7-bisphosphatase [Pseudoneurospora amorphoporcata]